jgi:sulfur carrier protein
MPAQGSEFNAPCFGRFLFEAIMTNIYLNGETRSISGEVSITKLLEELNIPCAGTAVALNETVVAGGNHAEQVVREGDRIEIIRAIGGG